MKAKELIRSYDNKEECVGTAQWCKEVAEELFSLQEENDYLSKRVDNLVVLHSNALKLKRQIAATFVEVVTNVENSHEAQSALLKLFEHLDLLDLPCVVTATATAVDTLKNKLQTSKTS